MCIALTVCITLVTYDVITDTKQAFSNVKDKRYAGNAARKTTPQIATRTCTQQERQKHVTDMCRKFNQQYNAPIGTDDVNGETDGANRLIVGDYNKIAWCRVPKAASRTMTRVLSEARQISSTQSNNTVQKPYWLKQANLNLVINKSIRSFHGYKKLLVVRHPYDRIVSAFYDKIKHTHAHSSIIQKARRKIQDFEGNNATYFVNNQVFTTIKFDSFLSQIVLSSDPLRWNAHWTEITALCDVCADWDYILKLETLDSDINLLLDSWNVTRKMYRKVSGNFSFKEKEKAVRNDQAKMSFTSDLSLLGNISEQSLNGLKQRYGRDAALFGYDVNMDTYMGTCGIRTDSGDLCC